MPRASRRGGGSWAEACSAATARLRARTRRPAALSSSGFSLGLHALTCERAACMCKRWGNAHRRSLRVLSSHHGASEDPSCTSGKATWLARAIWKGSATAVESCPCLRPVPPAVPGAFGCLRAAATLLCNMERQLRSSTRAVVGQAMRPGRCQLRRFPCTARPFQEPPVQLA